MPPMDYAKRREYIIQQCKTRSLRSLADELGVSFQRIQQIVQKAGVVRDQKPFSPRAWWRDPQELRKLQELVDYQGLLKTCKPRGISHHLLSQALKKIGYIVKGPNVTQSEHRLGDPDKLARFINDHGVVPARKHYGVHNQTLRKFLERNGYSWVKEGRCVWVSKP